MHNYIRKFEEMGLGMAIHWGLYSQVGEGEWTQHMKPYALDEYGKLKDTFTAENYDPGDIARLAKRAGMKFIMLTTRHHDGFSLYDTKGLNDFDAPHSPAGRDLIADFVEACRAEGISPFFYHTTLDWHWRGVKTWDASQADFDDYLEYLSKSVELLCRNYGEIGGIIFDGNWSRPDLDWKDGELYGMIRSLQPETIIMNNTGLERGGELDHPEIDAVTFEQGAVTKVDTGKMSKEVASMRWQTTNSHWGIGSNDITFKSPVALIEEMTHSRRYGAVHVINIGPTAQGAVQEIDRAVLNLVGRWMDHYGEAFYRGRPSEIKCQGRDFVLERDDRAWYFCYDLGIAGHENVTHYDATPGPRGLKGICREIKGVRWMDNGEELRFTQDCKAGLAAFDATGFSYGANLGVRVAEIKYAD